MSPRLLLFVALQSSSWEFAMIETVPCLLTTAWVMTPRDSSRGGLFKRERVVTEKALGRVKQVRKGFIEGYCNRGPDYCKMTVNSMSLKQKSGGLSS